MINTILRDYFEANPTSGRRLDRIIESMTKKNRYELPDAEMQNTAKAVFRTLSAVFPEDRIRAELMIDGDGKQVYMFSKAGERTYIASLHRTKEGLTVLPAREYESIAHDIERFLGPDDISEKPFEVNAYATYRGRWGDAADVFELTGMEEAARGVYDAVKKQFPNLKTQIIATMNPEGQLFYMVNQIGSIQKPGRRLIEVFPTTPKITIAPAAHELERILGNLSYEGRVAHKYTRQPSLAVDCDDEPGLSLSNMDPWTGKVEVPHGKGVIPLKGFWESILMP